MKNLIKKVCHHGKKITIHLKSQPKWVVRCMFGIGAILGLALSLHARTIGGTNADGIECPTGQQLATGDVCITNEKDIVIQAIATENNQKLKINKYFANAYTVDRGDGTTGNLTGDSTHTYENAGIYNIILSLSGGTGRWIFNGAGKPLVPQAGTTMTGIKITYMPSLMEGFGDNATNPGNLFFSHFNSNGAITSLPEGSFDTSNITSAGDGFFTYFNYGGALTSLPEGSFRLSTGLTTVGDYFFFRFNNNGVGLTSLPEGSFNTSNITSVGNFFFCEFNMDGTITSLPEGSFKFSTGLTAVGNFFFGNFNQNGAITSLPEGSFDISNITSVGIYFFSSFNSNGAIINLPEGSFMFSTGLTTVGDYFFSRFNYNGFLTSLSEYSFDTSNVTTVGDYFFGHFNQNGAITSLPEGSFNTSNITSAGDHFFSYFNCNGAITSLPDSFTITYVSASLNSEYEYAFNTSGYTLNKKVSDLVSGVAAPIGDRNTFSNNQPGRCGVHEYWLDTKAKACSINYDDGKGGTGTFKYNADATGVVVGSGMIIPTISGYAFEGWYTDSGLKVDEVIFPDMDGQTLYARWIDNLPPDCNVEYSTTGPTNQNVIATLTCEEDDITVTNNDGHMEYTFENIGTFTFEFQDLAGNTGTELAAVTWIDKDIPSCDVAYSTTGATTGNVTATLTCEEEEDGDITVTNNSGNMEYTFENTGTFTFEFQDLAGNTGSADAVVTWINKTKPTCDVIYSTTGATTGNVTATLTGCSGTITGTNLQHTFTGNGTYTFNFQDLLGNTGNADAEVTWINNNYSIIYDSGANITYKDSEGREFTGIGTITISNGENSITMLDRNLGATTNDTTKTGSYGYRFQWGNNYGFKDGCWTHRCSDTITQQATTTKARWNDTYNHSGYYGTRHISLDSEPYDYWQTGLHNGLRGGENDSEHNNWGFDILTGTASNRQGPCPDGFHVPSAGEWGMLVKYYAQANNIAYSGSNGIYSLNGDYSGFMDTFKLPLAGTRFYYSVIIGDQGSKGAYRSSSLNNSGVYRLLMYKNHYQYQDNVLVTGDSYRVSSFNMRCFKNPSSTGTTFSISFDDNIKPGEYTTFTVRVLKNGLLYNDYTGSILFTLTNKKGGLVNKKSYTIYNSGHYTFEAADGGRKTFYSGLKITDTGTYILEIRGLDNGGMGSGFVYVGGKHNAADFEYDTLKFNPNYSDEMNEAYQYARYFDITTKDNIKEADMYSGLNRIAMAKMLTNYAENVLGINNYNTGRNCKFVDVSTSLDKDYDYGVTKACQLGIMGVNMPNNKFYPNGGVTRAEFATALSRLLYGTPDGVGQYYSTHLVKLYQEKIITNTDPTLQELRGYVMLMLKRSAGK